MLRRNVGGGVAPAQGQRSQQRIRRDEFKKHGGGPQEGVPTPAARLLHAANVSSESTAMPILGC